MILTGNTIVVAGGGSGIGRGLARAFERRDNALIVAGQSSHAAQDTAATPGMAHPALDQEDPAFGRAFRCGADARSSGDQRPHQQREHPARGGPHQGRHGVRGGNDRDQPARPHPSDGVAAAAADGPSAGDDHQHRARLSAAGGCADILGDMAAVHSYTVLLRHQIRATGIQAIEVVLPMMQTAQQGAQGHHPDAMPLPDLIAEVMALFEAEPKTTRSWSAAPGGCGSRSAKASTSRSDTITPPARH